MQNTRCLERLTCDGACSRKFLRISGLSNGRGALREERRGPSASQHRLAVLLPLVHLLKLLDDLMAQLVHLRW